MKNKARAGDAAYELRYEERDDYFKVDGWPIGDIEAIPSERGPLSERPEWLVNIITVAKIGGHANAIKYPPPNIIVWFVMDTDYNLVEFVDMTPARQMLNYTNKPIRNTTTLDRTNHAITPPSPFQHQHEDPQASRQGQVPGRGS